MRIALVYGPTAAGFPPLGALTLSTIAKQRGIAADVLPLPSQRRRREVARVLADFDMVGISTDCGTYPDAILFARALKQVRPDLPVVFGGPQATVTAPQSVLAFPEVDLVVKGEAEHSFPDLLDRIAANRADWREVPGGVWIQDGVVQSRPELGLLADVDLLPLPDYAAFPSSGNNGTIPLEVGRGCPYGCTFCSTNTFFKRRFRMKSADRVTADVRALTAAYRINHVDFVHDMFTVRRDFVEDISAAMKRLPVSWNCSARTDRIDDALLQTMAEAGCTGIYVGIETGSSELQKVLKKNLCPTEAVARIRTCQSFGIGVTASLIIGYPQETREDLRATLLCGLELLRPHPSRFATAKVVVQFPFFAPLAGTPILADAPGGFEFDGVPPSLVELGESRTLPAETADLVMAHPDIFTAHYHPAATEIARLDYITIMHITSHLTSEPATIEALANDHAVPFVDFLLSPGVHRYLGPSQSSTTRSFLEAFFDPQRRSGQRSHRTTAPQFVW